MPASDMLMVQLSRWKSFLMSNISAHVEHLSGMEANSLRAFCVFFLASFLTAVTFFLLIILFSDTLAPAIFVVVIDFFFDLLILFEVLPVFWHLTTATTFLRGSNTSNPSLSPRKQFGPRFA